MYTAMEPSTWASILKGPLGVCLGNGYFTVNVLDFFICFGLHSKRIRNMGLRNKRFCIRALEKNTRARRKGTMVNAMGGGGKDQ